MNASTASVGEMVNQSIQVITKPSVATFEQYERRGTLQNALVYVAITAALAGIFGLLGGLFGGSQGAVMGFLGGVVSTLVNFLLFTGVAFYVGRAQGGTGTFDEVAYAFSLFWVPLQIAISLLTFVLIITIVGICLVPFLAIAAIAANIYFAYLAVQSSMNLRETGKVWITLLAAGLASLIASALITAIFNAAA